jgi:hypothetical protein
MNKQRSAAVRGLVLVAGLVLPAGCTSTGGPITGADPLVSSGTPRAAAPAAGGTATAGATGAPAGSLPALPGAASATSPAALVGATPLPGDASRDLRAGDVAGTAVGRSASWGTQGSASLGGPERDGQPLGSGGAPVRLASGATLAPAMPAGSGGDTFERLMEELRRRGVTWWRLEPYGSNGEFRFRCSVPSVENRNLGRSYEARAAGDNGVAAIRSVLDQIDHDRTPSGK